MVGKSAKVRHHQTKSFLEPFPFTCLSCHRDRFEQQDNLTSRQIMTKIKEEAFLAWQCRFGLIPDCVEVFGSWDEFAEPVPLSLNGSTMFSTVITLSTPNTYFYYFVVDGIRWTDTTKTMTTMESDEYNVLRLPIEMEKRGMFILHAPLSLLKSPTN